MKIRSTLAASAATLALGAVVVNSSAAPVLAGAGSSSSRIAQMAATEGVAPEHRTICPVVAAGLAGYIAAKRGRTVDSTLALATTSDALFDFR